MDFEKYDEYCKKVEYESVMKKQKQQYFFKKRFKSQRNTSVTTGAHVSTSNANIGSKIGKVQVPHHSSSNVNNSLLIQHERISIKSSAGSIKSANYSLTSKSPTAFDENQIPIRGVSKGLKNSNPREIKQFHSSLGQKPKSCVRKTQQNSKKNHNLVFKIPQQVASYLKINLFLSEI